MRLSSRSFPRAAAVAALGAALGLTGCPGSGSRTIGATRTASQPSKLVKPDATSAERFELAGRFGPPMGGGGTAAGPARKSPIAWTLPAGWTTKPDASGMRLGSFGIANHPEGDVSIVLLPGGVQGVAANVNRWRKQMGLPPLADEAVQQLPTRNVLGGTAVIVEVEGAYAGMGGQAPQQGWKLLGAIRPLQTPEQASTLFVKFTGPAALVDAEHRNFDALCDSLRVDASAAGEEDDQAPDQGGPRPEMPRDGAHAGLAHGQQGPVAGAASPLQWQAPSGWVQAGERPMRLVTFLAGPSQATECYVTVLPGNAGGVEANLNRWRKQMGQPELDASGLAALPRVKVLGADAPLMEVTGDFTDMQGQRHSGETLLAVVVPQAERMVFVKMVGPATEVRAERARFEAFLGSLR